MTEEEYCRALAAEWSKATSTEDLAGRIAHARREVWNAAIWTAARRAREGQERAVRVHLWQAADWLAAVAETLDSLLIGDGEGT